MERVAVTSTNVLSVGHEDNVLEIEFIPHTRKDGLTPPNVYRATPVAAAFFERVMAANAAGESVGKIINDLRRDPTVQFFAVALEMDVLG